jgi:hypothetical protein
LEVLAQEFLDLVLKQQLEHLPEVVSKLDVLMMSRLFHMILLEGKVVSVEEEFNLISI